MSHDAKPAIFITGGAGGMGRATGSLFASHGWFVGLADMDAPGLAAAKEAIGADQCFTAELDVTNSEQFDAVIKDFGEASTGRLDVLFNNAGIAPGAWFDEMPLETMQKVIDINVNGVIYGIRAGLPMLKDTPNSLCISTSSSVATHGHALRAVYSASKFAVKGLTEALSLEFDRFDIRCADVLPGCIDTPMLRNALAASAGKDFDEAMLESLPQDGAYRLVPVSEIANAVWQAYNTSGQTHWYVPEEIGDIDRLVGTDFAAAREETREFLFGRNG